MSCLVLCRHAHQSVVLFSVPRAFASSSLTHVKNVYGPLGFKTLPNFWRLQNILLPLYFLGNNIPEQN